MSDGFVESRAEEPAMRIAHAAGFFLVLMMAGCAGVKPPPGTQPQSTAPPAAAKAAAPALAATAQPGPAAPTVATQAAPSAVKPASPPVTPSKIAFTDQSTIKAAPSAAKAPAKAPAAQPPKKKSVAPEVAKKTSPTLDLASLEQRLKDTNAIGVLTKIALKNQVDDLLDQFRAFYQGKLKTTLAELRRPYDLLVLKVLSLLQDSDPPLASAIAASREAIWGILADPAKFATVS
jgi:hypothetical protein